MQRIQQAQQRAAVTRTPSVQRAPQVVNYFGHSGSEDFGKTETLFGKEDLETLAVDGQQPIFTAMTCISSRFAVPALVSLGEALLIDDEAAIAVWGPSGKSINAQASLLAQAFLEELTSGEYERLGPMIANTFEVVKDLEFGRDMMEIYHLFGDPALRLVPKADEPAPDGGPGPGASGGGGCGCGVVDDRADTMALGWVALFGLAVLVRRRRRSTRPL